MIPTNEILASFSTLGGDLIDAGQRAIDLAAAHPLAAMMAVTLISVTALGRGGQTN
ncbi:hypothetical protein [Phenylobacterium sp.]|uniref:hypothetical protein n=1 Tax=Phenylobacterium sp. TaxID=1871053 RepID=UPI002F407A9E